MTAVTIGHLAVLRALYCDDLADGSLELDAATLSFSGLFSRTEITALGALWAADPQEVTAVLAGPADEVAARRHDHVVADRGRLQAAG